MIPAGCLLAFERGPRRQLLVVGARKKSWHLLRSVCNLRWLQRRVASSARREVLLRQRQRVLEWAT